MAKKHGDRKRKARESQAQDRTAKKEKLMNDGGTRVFGVKPVYLVGVFVFGFILFSYIGSSGPEKAERIVEEDPALQGNTGSQRDLNSLYIPISSINDGKAHFYEFPSVTGKTIRFFVLKSSDGVFRAAFDACDVCFREKKGYRQEGDIMVCNNCGMKFPSTKINVEKGGCNPSPLERAVVGDSLVIRKSDIEAGVRYF